MKVGKLFPAFFLLKNTRGIVKEEAKSAGTGKECMFS
jgi:hypothetical protein